MAHKRSRIKLPLKEYRLLTYKIMQRDHWRCTVCKRRNNLHAHHIIFRSQGGDDLDSNLITVCDDCHTAIHDRYVVLLPQKEGQEIDANKGVKQLWINGWKPKYKVRNAS